MRIQKYPKPYLSNRDPGNRECESHSELAEIRSLQAAWWYLHPKKLQGPWQEREEERRGMRKEGKLASCVPFFFFFFLMYLHPTKILRNSPEAGMAPHTQVNGWDGRSRSSTCLVYESSDLGLYRKFRERIGAKIFPVTLES